MYMSHKAESMYHPFSVAHAHKHYEYDSALFGEGAISWLEHSM